MRILSATTTELLISRVENGSKCYASNLDNDPAAVELLLSRENAYLILVCVELGDTISTIKEIAARVRKQWQTHAHRFDNVVLVPFGHLSDNPEPDKQRAIFFLDKLLGVLENKGIPVSLIPVNYANCLFSRLAIFDSGDSVRFSSSEDGLKAGLRDLLRVYGTQQVLSTLSELLTTR